MPNEDREFDGVVFHRSLFEFREGFLNIRAVVSLTFVLTYFETAAFDEDGILDGR